MYDFFMEQPAGSYYVRGAERSQCITLINPGLGRSKFSLITSLDGPDLKGAGGIETRLLLDDSENFQVKEKVPRFGGMQAKNFPPRRNAAALQRNTGGEHTATREDGNKGSASWLRFPAAWGRTCINMSGEDGSKRRERAGLVMKRGGDGSRKQKSSGSRNFRLTEEEISERR